MSAEILLETRHLTKRYAGQVALADVNFRARRGMVNVLIGENGAGKSTLMRILSGVERPDEGEVLLDGAPIVLRSPRDASALGISIVHQELSLLPNLDVAENIFAGRELVRSASLGTLIDRPGEDKESRASLSYLRRPLAPTTAVAALSLGSRQVVELARSVTHGARVVLLDEPTSALSTVETENLYAVVDDLKRRGVTLIYISHRLHELLHLGDWFTVLRGGCLVGEGARGEVDRTWIVERMSGRAKTNIVMAAPAQPGKEILRVESLSVAPASDDEAGRAPVSDITFTLRRGEILGLYGLLGSGRTELLEALAGCRASSGTIHIQGRPRSLRNVREAVRAGLVLVPENRQRDGLLPDLSIRENVMIGAGGLWITPRADSRRVRVIGETMNLAAPDLELPVTTLSGGNQQKVLLARCLMASPKVLLLDEPTRGVDVGAKAEIYQVLRKLAAEGLAILFTSSEIEETRLLADRVLVMRQGRIGSEFLSSTLTDEALFAAASPIVTQQQQEPA